MANIVAHSVADNSCIYDNGRIPNDFESHALATAMLQLAGAKEKRRTAITILYKSAKMLRTKAAIRGQRIRKKPWSRSAKSKQSSRTGKR